MGNDTCAWRATIGIFNCRRVLVYKNIRVKVNCFFVELLLWIQFCFRNSCYSLQICLESLQNNINFNIILLLLLLEAGDIELNPGPENNYCITGLHCNIRSIRNKLDFIIDNFLENDFLCFTETHLNNLVCIDDLVLSEKYDYPYRKDRTNHGGGILVYVSKNIVYEKGINYYGQQGKRGFEYKNVTVTPSQKTVSVSQPDKIVSTVPSVSSGSTSTEGPKVVETFFDLSPWGGSLVPMKRLKNGDYAITTKYILDNKLFVKGGGGLLNLWDVSGLNEIGEVKGEIKDGELLVNGLSFGTLMSTDTQEAEYQYQAESTTKFVSKSRPMITGIRDGEAIIRLIRFALTTRK